MSLSETDHDVKHDDESHREASQFTPDEKESHDAAIETPAVAHHGQPDAGDVEKSASSKPPTANNAPPPPNGGLVAWLQVMGSFFLIFNTWGIVNTFGAYQTFYETDILSSESPSNIAWIGSIQAFLLMFIGSLTGPVYDAGYIRHLLIGGSFLVVFGQMMLSLCTEYYQIMLAQAVCIGLGTGCLFVPAVSVLSTYFTTRLATAMGIAAAGSSLGGVIYPIVLYRLTPRIGFPWAARVLGFIMLGTLLVSNSVVRVRVLPAGRRKIFDLVAWKEPPYVFFAIGATFGFMGIFIPFFYLQSYAIQTNITTPDVGFYLLAVLNGASTFGRVIPNYIADRTGSFNVLIPCTFVSGILCLCLIPARSTASVYVLAALYGFASGTFVSLPPTIYVKVSSHARNMIGTRMGMGFAVMSLGILIGTPVSGAILDGSSFTYVWVFGGLMTVLGGALITVARVCWGGWSLKKVL